MTVTITHAGVMMTPAIVLDGYESDRTLGTRAHDVIGSSDPDVTYGAASLRRGTLRLVFTTQAAAVQCEVQHIQTGTFTLVDTDVSSVGMTYVPIERLTTRLDNQTGWWVVTVPYREVLP